MKQKGEDNPIANVIFKEARILADLGAVAQDLDFTMQTCSRLKVLLREKSKDSILIEN